MNNKNIFILFLVLIVLSSSLSSAFGVSLLYSNKKPLILGLGETKIVNLTLQNGIGGKDLLFEVEVFQGENIASLVDDPSIYGVPYGSYDIKVPVKIKISKDIEVGEINYVGIKFSEISPVLEEGNVKISGGINIRFPVEASENILEKDFKEKGILEKIIYSVSVLIILILIVLIIFSSKKIKERKERKKKNKLKR